MVKLAQAKRGFVLLPRRWVVERSFAWLARFRRLSRDYEWLPATLAGPHWLAFSGLMLSNLFKLIAINARQALSAAMIQWGELTLLLSDEPGSTQEKPFG